MKLLNTAICVSAISSILAALAVAQSPDNGSATVRKIKINSPQPTLAPVPMGQTRPRAFIPEPVPAPAVGAPVPAANNGGMGISEPAEADIAPVAEETSNRANNPCPAETNGSRPGCFRNRLKSCCWWRHDDITPEMPFGASLNAAMKTQVCNGLAAQMVLYRYDFCDTAPCDAHKLNIHGEKRLGDLAWRMQYCGMHPLLIESTPENPAVAAARRDYVAKMLRDSNFAAPDEWVVVGDSTVRGMTGTQALRVDKRMRNELISPDDSKNAQEMESGGGTSGGLGGSGGYGNVGGTGAPAPSAQ